MSKNVFFDYLRRHALAIFQTMQRRAHAVRKWENGFPTLPPRHFLHVAIKRFHGLNPTKHMFHRTVDGNKFATSIGQIIRSCFKKFLAPRLSVNPAPPISMLHLGLAALRTCNHCFHRRRTIYTSTLKLGGRGI